MGLALAQAALGRAEEVAGDHWVSNTVVYPFEAAASSAAPYAQLHAESVAGTFKVVCSPEKPDSKQAFQVYASAADLGHWRARDWQEFAMVRRGTNLEATIPVEAVEVPIVYFVRAVTEAVAGQPARTNCSPMRICLPEKLGLLEPSRAFWPFLEGFEEGLGPWHLAAPTPETPALRTDAAAKTGNAALLVSLAAKQNSVTVGTTQLRGWQLKRQGAIGVRLWLRTRTGTGRAKFCLLANAYSPEQKVSVWQRQMTLSEKWQKMDLFFSELPGLELKAVDLFTVELIGTGPMEFLLDDVQLIGPWRMEPE